MLRCKFVELQNYSEEELNQIVHLANPALESDAIKPIIKASKGVPRTALSLAKSLKAGAITEKYETLDANKVNSLLDSRFKINGDTGLSEKEFKIVQKVIERGQISSTAVANMLGCSLKDAKMLYIEPLRAAEWLAVSTHGVIPGYKAHRNYRIFTRKATE